MQRIIRALFILAALGMFAEAAVGETPCPSDQPQYCFQCVGSESVYRCCFDKTQPTGYQCLKTACSNPTPVDCPPSVIAEWEARVAARDVEIARLQKELIDLKPLCYHPNGQSYKDHWEACGVTCFQLYCALHGGCK